MTELSRLANIYEQLGKSIQEYRDEKGRQIFKDIPIKWDMVEVTPNDSSPTMIIFSAKEWQDDNSHCLIERQLDISITHNSKVPRDITLNLTKFSEDLKKVIDELSLTVNFEIKFLQGSPIGYLKPIRKDNESYKTAGTVLNSIIVLSYLLRY